MVRYHHYTAASHEFLRKAHEELAQGDLVQASEKGWGAAAQMVKAIAEQRGWRHNSHPRLHQIVDTLVKETVKYSTSSRLPGTSTLTSTKTGRPTT